MRELQIVDLDGCISDDRWRRSLIVPLTPGEKRWEDDHKRFERYHAMIPYDRLANLHELRYNCTPIILTSRPLAYREMTMWWLQEKGIRPLHIIFRNNNDLRPSVEVKRDMVRWLFDYNMYGVQREEVLDAIDDRRDIVKMYQELQLPARVVQIANTEGD